MFVMMVYIKHLHFIIIMSMNVVGLRLYVLSYATHSFSDDHPPPLPPPSSSSSFSSSSSSSSFLPLLLPFLPNCKLLRNSIKISSK